jgi:tetratricopeptide (TPR) repeat protein
MDRLGRSKEAIAKIDQSGSIFQVLYDARPDYGVFAQRLAENRKLSGEISMRLGRVQQGISRLNEVRSIYERLARAHPEREEYAGRLSAAISQLARARAAAGEFDAAFRLHREAMAILESGPKLKSDFYNQACAHGLYLATMKQKGSGVSATDAEAEAKIVIALLGAAIENGFRDFAHIATDQDLEAVRRRSDFRLLMMDATFPQDVFQ